MVTCFAAGPATGDPLNDPLEPDAGLLLAGVEVNGFPQGVALLAQDRGRILADAETLAAWRLALPDAEGVEISGRRYYPLDAFPGLTTSLDRASMTVAVDVPPVLLAGTARSLSKQSPASSRFDAFGGFFDYDLSLTRQTSESASLSGLLSPTIFTRHGSLSTDVLYNSSGDVLGVSDPGWRRLETTWTIDNPERMRSIRIGDALTEGSGWARSVRFGGFQIARNFDTRPTEITFPQPSIAGMAAVPTTLDIYVNGQMRSQIDVPGGAFEIQDIPVVTGTGQVQVVARDLLGRQQIITQDFYASQQLLKRDLNAWSLSLGKLRENFTQSSNDYGDSVISASFSRGLSNQVTLGSRFDATPGTRVAGLSLARAFGRAGLMSTAAATSASNDRGSLWLVGYQFQRRQFRANFRVQGTTAGFSQPGIETGTGIAFPRRQIAASAGISLRQHGSVGVSFVRERRHDGDGRRIASLGYSRSLGFGLMLSFAASRVHAATSYTESSLSISRSVGPRSSTTFAHARRADGNRTRVDHRYELPSGPGIGYRTSLQKGNPAISDAQFLLNTGFAHYSAELRRRDGNRAVRLQSRGSVARLGGGWFAARAISDGFAVVDAGGHSDVRVYLENRLVGETREDGRLLVPGLRPYEQNRLRLETADIPLAARIGSPALAVSPYYRSGAIASFGVRSTRSVVVRLLGPDGEPVAEGSRASVDGGPFDFPVGLAGRLYLEGVDAGSEVDVLNDGRLCRFVVPALGQNASFIDIGERYCRDDPNG